MRLNRDHSATWAKVALYGFAGCALIFTLVTPRLCAQTSDANNKPAESRPADIQQVFHLTYATSQQELNDIQTALRNMLPRAKIYGTASSRAISLSATAEDMEAARKLIAELDRPRKTYRLTYTITDFENGKQAGVQHVALVVNPVGHVNSGDIDRTTFRQGTKVPIVVAMKDGEDASGRNSGVQYVDVGLKIEASLEVAAEALTLNSKFEQSSVADDQSGALDPVMHATVLENHSNLVEGKPLVLGSMELPGGTKRLEVAVVAEAVK